MASQGAIPEEEYSTPPRSPRSPPEGRSPQTSYAQLNPNRRTTTDTRPPRTSGASRTSGATQTSGLTSITSESTSVDVSPQRPNFKLDLTPTRKTLGMDSDLVLPSPVPAERRNPVAPFSSPAAGSSSGTPLGLGVSPLRMPVNRPDVFTMETPRDEADKWAPEETPRRPEGMDESSSSLATTMQHASWSARRLASHRGVDAMRPIQSENIREPVLNQDTQALHHDGSEADAAGNERKCNSCSKMKCGIVTVCVVLISVIAVVVTVLVGGKGDGHSGPPPLGDCTTMEITHGCAPGFCKDSRCWCEPTEEQITAAGCAQPMDHKSMEFYMYRALPDGSATGDDLMGLAYSLEGMMWHLHAQVVVRSCPRALGITRVVRLKATVFNTDVPYDEWRGQFGPFVDISQGKCVSANCSHTLTKYGSVVGCLKWQPSDGGGYGASYGNKTQTYSLPGACPSESFPDKTAECRKQAPGGQCTSPDGTSDCTWNLESAGEVRLDDLEGIKDYKAFCAAGGKEYNDITDKGTHCTFWNNISDSASNSARAMALVNLFRDKYPSTELPDPTCDSQNAQCKYHQGCHDLSGDCCPASNGMFLSCCKHDSDEHRPAFLSMI